MQSQGRLREDLDCAVFGATLFKNANRLFFDFTRSENKTYLDLTEEIETMSKSLVHLALPSGTSI